MNRPAIVQSLMALQDPNLRLRRLARFLTEAPEQEVAPTIEQAARNAQSGQQREFYVTLVQLLLHVRPRPVLPGGPLPMPERQWLLSELRVANLIGAAVTGQLPFAARLLRDAFAPPRAGDERLLPPHPSIEPIPLGTRRERARLPRKDLLLPLLLDTTPSVVLLLAENPRIVQAHALQMATLRPTHPYALQALLMPLRWLADEKIAEAVARNPAAPAWLVLALAPLLPRKVLAALVHLAWIDASVRALLAGWLGLDGQVIEAAVATAAAGRDPEVFYVDEAELHEPLQAPGGPVRPSSVPAATPPGEVTRIHQRTPVEPSNSDADQGGASIGPEAHS